MTQKKDFRIYAKNFFLTYINTGSLTKEDTLKQLKKIFDISQYCIGKEIHDNGENHIHVFS